MMPIQIAPPRGASRAAMGVPPRLLFCDKAGACGMARTRTWPIRCPSSRALRVPIDEPRSAKLQNVCGKYG